MKKATKFEALWLFIAAMVVSCLIYSLGYLLEKSRSPENVWREFQTRIRTVEMETRQRNKQVCENLNAPENLISGSLKSLDTEINSDFHFSDFIFKNDTLVWWNDHFEVMNKISDGFRSGNFSVQNLPGGWVGCFGSARGKFTCLTLVKIKSEYPVQNRYLRKQFAAGFPFSLELKLTSVNTPFPVHAVGGKLLFFLDFSAYGSLTCRFDLLQGSGRFLAEILTVVLFLLANLLFYLALFKLFKTLSASRGRDNRWFLFFSLLVLVSRYGQSLLKIPGLVYELDLFRPAWYSSSALLPSPGDMIILLLLMAWLLVLVYKRPWLFNIPQKKGLLQTGGVIVWICILVLVNYFAVKMISSLVQDSAFPVNFRNIAEFSPISSIGLAIILLINLSLGLFSWIAWNHISAVFKRIPLAVALVMTGVASLAVCFLTGADRTLFFLVISLTGFGLVYQFAFNHSTGHFTLQQIVWLILWFACLNTIILDRENQIKTEDKISLFALKIASGHNPVTEQKYGEISEKIAQDLDIKQHTTNKNSSGETDSINQFIKKRYFRDYWTKYNIQVTMCSPGKQLLIQPQSTLNDCQSYFDNIIQSYGTPTSADGLYCLDVGYGMEYYIGVITFNQKDKGLKVPTKLYIEFTVNGSVSEPGYPSLLLDQEKDNIAGLPDFSYAIYRQGSLIHSVGNILYPLEMPVPLTPAITGGRYGNNGEVNYYFKISQDTGLMVGYKFNRWLSFFTQISYLFILFALAVTLFTGYTFIHKRFRITGATLRLKLQWLLTGMILLTMIVLGVIQITNIIKINQIKNIEYLREKGYSVKTEFQHKFGAERNPHELAGRQPENFLIKIANVFFTDVNFFDPSGRLMASSRMRIFREGLISDRINPAALNALRNDKTPLVILNEKIGYLTFASAYLPLFNDYGTLLGYIHLPYFARQDALKNEITSFLVTFANIYILLILAAVFLSILISNYLTSPLVLLSGKLNSMNPGGKNEKIQWQNRDEIGTLVDIYNKKVEELEYNVQQLAASEREKAWRTMARQVAHEIKNPLTPMKLSAQHLQRAAREGAPDLDKRIEKFTRTLVEQIDELAMIASDFSTFAKMPDPVPEQFDLSEQLERIMQGWLQTPRIVYSLHITEGNYPIFADRSRFSRIVTNLLNNATQSIVPERNGLIRAALSKENQHYVLSINDNGCGIPAEMADRIFQPEFTTKSGGMGLGLAIVREMVLEMKGSITFESVQGEGSTFFVKIPVQSV